MGEREKVSAWLYEAMKANKKTVSDVTKLTEICDSKIRAYIYFDENKDGTQFKMDLAFSAN